MRARCDLGNHAAEPGVLVDAGGHLVGQQRHGAVGAELGDADSGFVAGALDGQDDRHAGSSSLHRVGVGAADAVVALAQADVDEAGALVQRDRGRVVGAHLEEDRAAGGEFEQPVEQLACRCPGPGTRDRRRWCESRTRRAASGRAARCPRSRRACRRRGRRRSGCAWLRVRAGMPARGPRIVAVEQLRLQFRTSRGVAGLQFVVDDVVIGGAHLATACGLASGAARYSGISGCGVGVPVDDCAPAPTPSGRPRPAAAGRTARRARVNRRPRRRRRHIGGRVDGRAVDAHAVAVARPVHLAAARVGDDEHLPGGVDADRVQAAHAVHRDAEGLPVGGGGGHADPQAGERPRAATHDDGVEVVHRDPGVGQGARAHWASAVRRARGRRR